MFWDFLLYAIPWWVWLTLGLVIAAALFLLAVRAFGWEQVKPWVLPVITVLGAGALLTRARQQGWKDKVRKDLDAADRLIKTGKTAREKQDARNQDVEKLREDDGYRRD